MDARQRWQALQAHLTSARVALDAGDRTKALAEVDAALALDPNFLAAHSLRQRALAPRPVASQEPPPASGIAPPAMPAPAAARPVATDAAVRPLVSVDGYAKFEQRAKRRRVDRRIDAARAAIQRRKLKQAASALDEVIELDPNLPELAALTAEFDELRRMKTNPRRGPWVAAAMVFAITVFGATWLHDTNALLSRATSGAVPLLNPPAPAVAVSAFEPEPVATVGTDDPGVVGRAPTAVDSAPIAIDRGPVAIERAAGTIDRAPSILDRAPSTFDRPVVTIDHAPSLADRVPSTTDRVPATVERSAGAIDRMPTAIDRPIDRPAAFEAASTAANRPPEPVAALASPAPIAPSIPRVDEESLVKQTLQQYRRAYEGLDAHSAQAVYPAVNQAALARAFDALSSQSLTFDACDVRLNGGSATATCRGSARYTAKVGSRDPKIEPRTWNFTLRKNGSDWKIENARAER